MFFKHMIIILICVCACSYLYTKMCANCLRAFGAASPVPYFYSGPRMSQEMFAEQQEPNLPLFSEIAPSLILVSVRH